MEEKNIRNSLKNQVDNLSFTDLSRLTKIRKKIENKDKNRKIIDKRYFKQSLAVTLMIPFFFLSMNNQENISNSSVAYIVDNEITLSTFENTSLYDWGYSDFKEVIEVSFYEENDLDFYL